VKRILVVDDEPTILAALATRLRAEEFLVETAVDGPSAVATAAATDPDLVVLVAGVVALLGLAAVNPERLIAERNIDRYEQTGSLDTGYLLGLSTDVEPALWRLPETIAQCARYRDEHPDAWYEFNLSRARASQDGTPGSGECYEYWDPDNARP
jgi:hypothetical protein